MADKFDNSLKKAVSAQNRLPVVQVHEKMDG
jgi:hypothetical protein